MRFSTLALAASLCAAAPLSAQDVLLPIQPEGRLDLITGKHTALQAGAGVSTPVATNFRIGLVGALGASDDGLSGRADAFVRFSLAEYAGAYAGGGWTPYVGGGTTTRLDSGIDGSRTYLLGFVGYEGPATNGLQPAVEVGIGGGIRLGVVLRGAVRGKDEG